MTRWAVEVDRTERIIFEVDADSMEDAVERYLGDGDETSSQSLEAEVVNCWELTPPDPLLANLKATVERLTLGGYHTDDEGHVGTLIRQLDNGQASEMNPWLLVEQATVYDTERYWLSLHENLPSIGRYQDGQDCPGEWEAMEIVDLRDGTRYRQQVTHNRTYEEIA